MILSEWKSREEVNPGVWIAIFLVAIVAINYFGIKFFGELEFWLSSIKVITIVSAGPLYGKHSKTPLPLYLTVPFRVARIKLIKQ